LTLSEHDLDLVKSQCIPLDPPEEVHTPKRITVGEGGVADVECRARGNPEPKVYWSLHNK